MLLSTSDEYKKLQLSQSVIVLKISTLPWNYCLRPQQTIRQQTGSVLHTHFISHGPYLRPGWNLWSHLLGQHSTTMQMKRFIDPIINLHLKTTFSYICISSHVGWCEVSFLQCHHHRLRKKKTSPTAVKNDADAHHLIHSTDLFFLLCLRHHLVHMTQVRPKGSSLFSAPKAER